MNSNNDITSLQQISSSASTSDTIVPKQHIYIMTALSISDAPPFTVFSILALTTKENFCQLKVMFVYAASSCVV